MNSLRTTSIRNPPISRQMVRVTRRTSLRSNARPAAFSWRRIRHANSRWSAGCPVRPRTAPSPAEPPLAEDRAGGAIADRQRSTSTRSRNRGISRSLRVLTCQPNCGLLRMCSQPVSRSRSSGRQQMRQFARPHAGQQQASETAETASRRRLPETRRSWSSVKTTIGRKSSTGMRLTSIVRKGFSA